MTGRVRPWEKSALTTVTSDSADSLSAWITLLLAFSCGLIVANIYYAQPLIGPISRDLGLSAGSAGPPGALGPIGYWGGPLVVVPLGGFLEDRQPGVGGVTGGPLALARAP